MINDNSPFSTQSSLRQALLAGAVLALATAAFFWQILFTTAWMPAGGGDLAPFLYPNYHFAAQTLRQGIIPLWNPHLYSGLPFAADAQSGLFYPVNLAVFLLTPNLTLKTLEYLAIFHFWLAGFGMYLFLRHGPQLNLRPLAALTGAIAFEFSDLFIVHFGNLNMIAVAAWLPLILLTFQLAIANRRGGYALASGALLAIASLAGHVQITLFILLALGLYALWEFWGDKNHRGAAVRYLLLTGLITVGLSALWLLPTLEMSRHTLRASLSYADAAAYSLNPAQLIGLLIPNYFGRDPALHWGPFSRVETGYIGVLTLLLAVIALALRADRQTRFMALLAGMSFLLALGDNAILHGWLSLSPGFGQFRAPARYILLLDFALATLAAGGLNHLLTPLTEAAGKTFGAVLRALTWILGGLTVVSLPLAYYALLVTQDRNAEIFRRAQAAATGVVTFAGLVAAGLILLHLAQRGRVKGTALGLSALILIGLDLFSLGANVDVGHADPTGGFNHPAALAFLRENSGLNRVEVTTDVWHLWQPDTALLNGLYDAWGLYNPLTLANTTRYWQEAVPRSSPAYNLLGIKYIVAGKGGAPADGNIVPVFDADPDINIYLNLSALPRLLFVHRAVKVDSAEAALAALKAPDFDATATVILEDCPATETTVNGSASIALQEYGLHAVQAGVNTTAPGYLFLADAWYPGWRATVDGQPTPVCRANYAFRAVPVPAGEHQIRLTFEPLSWKIGLGISGLTVLGLLAFVIIKKRSA